MSTIDNESYRKIHFAVMAIESGAKKLNKTLSINGSLANTNYCILKVLYIRRMYIGVTWITIAVYSYNISLAIHAHASASAKA